jgi:hypothetical protein
LWATSPHFGAGASRRSLAHLNMDIFVFAMSSVSFVHRWLLLILLLNESKSEKEARIALG